MSRKRTDPPRASPASRSVLLADDDALNRQLTRRLLEARGWSVAAVGDGRAALELAVRGRFDLVLLDVEMPGLDGPQVARRIRARESPNGSRTTVFALTSHRRSVERGRCLEAGMDGYLTKPLEPQALERLLAGGDEPAAAPERPAASGAVVDWQQALAAVDGDRRLLERLAASAHREVGERLTALAEGLASADAETARRSAHSLRGALRIFGAGQARELAAAIERLAAQARLEAAGERHAELAAALGGVTAALAAGPPDDREER